MERGYSPEHIAKQPEEGESLRNETLEQALDAIAGLAFLAEAKPQDIAEALASARDAVSATRDSLAEEARSTPRRDLRQRDITQTRVFFDRLYFPLQYLTRVFEAIQNADPSEQAALAAEHEKEIHAMIKTDIEPTLAAFRQEPPAKDSSLQRIVRRAAAAIALFTGTLVAFPSPTDSQSDDNQKPPEETLMQNKEYHHDPPLQAPNMNENPYEKKENRDAGVFATIDHVRGSTPSFWVSDIYGFSSDGQRVSVDPLSRSPKESGKVKATVHWKSPLSPNTDEAMRLPVPLGTLKTYTRGDLFTAESGTDSSTTAYSIHKENSENDVMLPRLHFGENRPEWKLGQDAQTLESALRKRDRSAGRLLKDYLSDFTYITSDDLQQMFDAMPVPWETAVGEVKAGDCDVLSDHIAQVLYSSGYSTGVARGFVEENNRLGYGAAHAKVIYEERNGDKAELETTAYTKDAYQGVDFLPEDAEQLWTLVRGMHAVADDPSALHAAIGEFRSTLEAVLSKPEYKQNENRPAAGMQFEAQLGDLLDKVREIFSEELIAPVQRAFTDQKTGATKELPLILGATSGAIASLIAFLYLLQKLVDEIIPSLQDSAEKRLRRDATQDEIAELLHIDLENLPYLSGKIEPAFSSLTQELKIQSDVPLTPGEKALVMLLDRVRNDTLRNWIFAASEKKEMKEAMSDLLHNLGEADEESAREHLVEFFRKIYEDPKHYSPQETHTLIEKHILPQQLKDVEAWLKGQKDPKVAQAILDPLAMKEEEREMILSRLRIKDRDAARSSRSSSRGRQNPIEPSYDFDLRDYDPVRDDASMMDWNATARLGHPIVRVRLPERMLPKQPKKIIENYSIVDLQGLMEGSSRASDVIIDHLNRRGESGTIECYAFGKRVATISPSRLKKSLWSWDGIEILLQEILTLQYRYGISTESFRADQRLKNTSDFMNSRATNVDHLNQARLSGSSITFFPRSEHVQSALVGSV